MLIEAAADSMAEDGIAGFTVDRICARANVSRGLITHHFGSMAGLLAATYAQLYDQDLPEPSDEPPDALALSRLFDHLFDAARFNRKRINTWLALWSAISNSPELTAAHRARYRGYLDDVTAYLYAAGAPTAPVLAPALLSLLDGLSLQHCIDPGSMPAQMARDICEAFLAPHFQIGKEPLREALIA